MQIIMVSGESTQRFMALVPSRMISSRNNLLGCLVDGEPCGAAVLERMEERCDLSWLYVREDRRRQGISSALLDAACDFSADKLGLPLTVSYRSEEPSAPILDYMLAKRGFSLRYRRLPQYAFNLDSLNGTPLMEGQDDGKWGDSILSLQTLRGDQINRFKLDCEEAGTYIVSRADFAAMDQKLSLALVENDRIGAITLLRRASENKAVLELLYLKNSDAVRGMAILRETARRAMSEGIELVEFVCVAESAKKLSRRLLGEPKSFIGISNGILDIGMYRKVGAAE